MGGVDLKDACINPYDATRKSYKWCVKYGIHLFQILHHNSWIIYRKCGGQKSYLSFLEATVDLWVLQTGEGRSRSASGAGRIPERVSDSEKQRSLPDHRLERFPPKPNQPHPAKKCRVCSQEKRRKETVFFCVFFLCWMSRTTRSTVRFKKCCTQHEHLDL